MIRSHNKSDNVGHSAIVVAIVEEELSSDKVVVVGSYSN